MYKNTIITADAQHGLQLLPSKSVKMCVTSPPYYKLRDYGVKGQIGLEETPEEYISRLVLVFRELKRVITDDGTLWIVIGDSYNGSSRANTYKYGDKYVKNWKQSTNTASHGIKPVAVSGLKPKDLIGIPWMLAFALRADGWYLRQDIIWHKSNPMPESVTDRCTKAHEYIFLLSKSRKYYFDCEAIEEIATGYDGRKASKHKGSDKYREKEVCPGRKIQNMAVSEHERWRFKNLNNISQQPHSIHLNRLNPDNEEVFPIRRKRDVWTIPLQPYKGAHFAVFPEMLAEYCILAGSSEGDTIIDPFFGSGTVGRVARKLKRNFIGIELNPDYVEIAKKRIHHDNQSTASTS